MRRLGEKSSAGGAARKAVRLVAAMALKDVSDGCNLGKVIYQSCTVNQQCASRMGANVVGTPSP